jgi:hypothetical protein
MAVAQHDPADPDDDELELEPSEVDELTHAELLCLYQDAEMNIRFAKLMQWSLTGSVTLIFVMIVLLGANQGQGEPMTRTLAIITQVTAPVAIYVLAILQSWQRIERTKIRLVLDKLSSLARTVYDTKSRVAANVERYVLLACMVLTILAGAGLTLFRLLRW